MDVLYRGVMMGYWAVNPGLAITLVVWGAFNAYTRGLYQTIIAKIRIERRTDLTRAKNEASVQKVYIRSTLC